MPSLILFPRLRRNGQGKAAESSERRFSLSFAPGWIDRLTLSRANERARQRRELLCRQERIIFGLWIEGSSYSICKHSCNLNFALLYFFHHPLRRHSGRCLNHTRKQLFARAGERSDASGAAPMAAPGHYIEAQEQLALLFSLSL